MKRFAITVLLLFASSALRADVTVVTTYPWIADIVGSVGKDNAKVHSLAPGSWDPHFVVPKPSMIARVRKAQLLIMNGAELEIGWLPPLIRESGNAKVQPGSMGLLDLSLSVKLIEVPLSVSRAEGDVHPSGNPHFHLDPYNIPIAAKAVCQRLCLLDPANQEAYRKNLETFTGRWDVKIKAWDKSMAAKKGMKVVEYHKLFRYFMKRYGIIPVASLEPLSGIPPTSQHLKKVIDNMKGSGVATVITDVYHPKSPASFVAEKTGARLLVIPHDIGSPSGPMDLEALFDDLVERFTHD